MILRGVSFRRHLAMGTLLLAFSGCTTSMRKAPNYEERRARIASVAVMPPDVEVREHAFKGSGRKVREDENRVRFNLASITTRLLVDRGVTAKRANLDESALSEKPDLRFKLTQLQQGFAREMDEAYQHSERRSKAFKAEHKLGSAVNFFSDRDQVDGLIFIRALGVRQSEGQKKLSFFLDTLIGIMTGVWDDPGSGEKAAVQIGLVDGSTGDVLWSDKGTAMDFDGMSMEHTIDRMVKGMAPGKKETK